MVRKIRDGMTLYITGLLTLLGGSILIMILLIVLFKGLPAIDIDFLTTESRDFGSEGGVLYQTIGTLILVFGAAVLSLPFALGSALYQTEYLKSPTMKRISGLLIYSLNGVPTIIFGLFGYIFFGIFLGLGISWLTGTFILAIMILPTIMVSIKEAVEGIPHKYREEALSLGLTPWQLIKAVVIPQSLFGIITGLLLGLARAAGETAAIMFTATTFSGVLIPRSFLEPVTTLQTHILVLAQNATNPTALTNAWGAGLILILIVFVMVIGSMLIRSKRQNEADR